MGLQDTTIEFDELSGSEAIELAEPIREASSAVRKFLIKWESREQFLADLLGGLVTAGGQQVLREPDKHPTWPWLYARAARVEGLGAIDADDTPVGYPKAVVTATYRPLTQDGAGQFGSEVFITETQEASAEMISIPKEKLFWDQGPNIDDPVQDEVTAAKRVVLIRATITVHHWANPPLSEMTDRVGKINGAAFTALIVKWPKEKLLFDGFGINTDITSQGIGAFQITYNFTFRSAGWQKLMNPDGKFYDVRPPPYETTSFDGLMP